MKKILALISLLLISFLISCSDDSVSSDDKGGSEIMSNGLTKDVNDLVPDSVIAKMEELGFPINKGNNPPNIEYSFYCDPLILINSNLIEDQDAVGWAEFDPLYIKFFNQNTEDLTVQCYNEQSNTISSGIGGYIIGDNNEFTVFLDIETTHDGNIKSKSVEVISGKLTDEGIEDFYISFFMIDDGGDPYDELIPIGGGRVAKDSDGMSEIIPDFESMGIKKKEQDNKIKFFEEAEKIEN